MKTTMVAELDRHLVLIEMEVDNLVAVLEFIFTDAWRFIGIVVMMLIISTWRLIDVDVDVTLFGSSIKDLQKEMNEDNKNG